MTQIRLVVTSEQQGLFQSRGYLLLEGAVPRARLLPLQQQITSQLTRAGVTRKRVPKSLSELPPFQQIGKLSELVTTHDLAATVVSPTLAAAVDALMPTRTATHQAQLLVSPPSQGQWRLDGLNWHSDVSRSGPAHAAAIQAFVLIDDVGPHAGGTLILSGSHRTRRDNQTEQRIRDALRKGHEGEAELHAAGLCVVELCGKAGDVYLMDMRVLHTPSINASTRFRMVATVRFFGA